MAFELTDVKENSFYAVGTIKDAWVLTAKNFFPLFIGWFLTLGGPLLITAVLTITGLGIDKMILHFPGKAGGPFTLIGLMFGVLAIGCFWSGWAKIALKVARGIPTKASDVICSPGQMLSGLIACAVTVTLISLGGLLIIPGFLLAIKWQLVPYFIVDQNCGPIEAMKRSWHATDNSIFIPMAVVSLAFLGLSAASGFIIIGPVICNMALAVASAIIYARWLTDEDAPFNRAGLLEDHDE